MKKIKYGKVALTHDSFDSEKALIRVSMMMPLNLIKDLKKLSLNEKHGGKYQLLIRDVLTDWAQHQKKSRKSS